MFTSFSYSPPLSSVSPSFPPSQFHFLAFQLSCHFLSPFDLLSLRRVSSSIRLLVNSSFTWLFASLRPRTDRHLLVCFSHLPSFCSLHHVDFSCVGFSLTPQHLDLLTTVCNNIHSLNLQGCVHLTDESIQRLSRSLRNLKLLNLSECVQLNDQALIGLSNTAISSLSLSFLTSLTSSGLLSLSSSHSLTHLDISFCTQFGSDFTRQLSAFPHLTSLNLSWLSAVSHLDITACSDIRILECRGCTGLLASELRKLSLNHHLQAVNLRECTQLVDQDIHSLVQACKSLTSIDISDCQQLTDISFRSLALLPRLTSLFAWNIPRMSDIGLQFISQNNQ
jgi:hypothetical protein